MPRDYRKGRKVRQPMRDYSRNLSVRMTEEQYQRLQRYMGMTRLNSTAYFCRLIQGNEFKGRSSKLNHALHTSINMIYSNARTWMRRLLENSFSWWINSVRRSICSPDRNSPLSAHRRLCVAHLHPRWSPCPT